MRYLAILLISLLASATIMGTTAYAATSGSKGQVVANEDVQLYVSDAQITSQSTAQVVTVTTVFKNLNFEPRLFNFFFIKLKDSEGVEYTPELFESTATSTYVPERDIAVGDFVFTIPSGSQPTRLTYTEFLESPLTVDLTTTKSPADSVPRSEWTVGSNAGYLSNDGRMELSINDERYDGTNYVVDITIRNIGKEKFPYNPIYAYVKDSNGYSHSWSLFADLAQPLSYGDLMPGDFVRGEVAFEVDQNDGPFMFIWQGNFGLDSYFNTGTPNFQEPAVVTPAPVADLVKVGAESTSIAELRTMDFSGNALNEVGVGDQILLMTDIINNNDKEQPFFALFELRDQYGVTLSIQIVTSDLAPRGSTGAGLSWMPEASGTYELRIFVISSLSQPEVLSPISSNMLAVSA